MERQRHHNKFPPTRNSENRAGVFWVYLDTPTIPCRGRHGSESRPYLTPSLLRDAPGSGTSCSSYSFLYSLERAGKVLSHEVGTTCCLFLPFLSGYRQRQSMASFWVAHPMRRTTRTCVNLLPSNQIDAHSNTTDLGSFGSLPLLSRVPSPPQRQSRFNALSSPDSPVKELPPV